MTNLAPVQHFTPALAVTPTAPVSGAFEDVFASVTGPTPLPCPPSYTAQPVQKELEPKLDVVAAIAPQKPTLEQAQPHPDEEKTWTDLVQRELPSGTPVSKAQSARLPSFDEAEIDLGSEAEKVDLERKVQPDPQPAAPVLAQVTPNLESARIAGPLLTSIVDTELKPSMHSAPSLPTPADLPKVAKPKHSLTLVSDHGQASATDTATATDSGLFQMPAAPQAAPTLGQVATPTFEVPVTVPTLDLMQDALWLDNLARDITASAATDGKLQFRLVPELLGKLDIALTHRDDRLDIAMQTSTEAAARIISGDQARLVEELRHSGVKVGNFEMFSGQQSGAQKQQNQQSTPLPLSAAIESKPQRQRNRDARFA